MVVKQRMYLQEKDGTYKCTTCGHTSQTASGIIGHQQHHKTFPEIKCGMCSKKFVRPTSYLKHMMKVHKVTDPKFPRSYRRALLKEGKELIEDMVEPDEAPYVVRELGVVPGDDIPTFSDLKPKAMVSDPEAIAKSMVVLEECLNHEAQFVVEDTVMKHLCTKCNAHHDYDIPGMCHCNLCGGELKQITYKHIRLV